MSASTVIVLVIDRLGAGWLGPYGNSWVDTPAFNRLASQSLLFDCAMVTSPDLETTYDAYWYGRHALEEKVDPHAVRTLMEHARDKDFRSVLVTDSPEVEGLYAAGDFDETISVPAEPSAGLANDLAETRLAQTIALAIDAVQTQTAPSFIWVHASGLNDCWDAPAAIVQRLVDEDDPLPPVMSVPPEMRLSKAFDPDTLLGITQTYAGQVMAYDMLLEVFFELIEDRPDTLFAVTSTRGYPLGEHLRVGNCDQALFGELLHVPLMIRFPGDREIARRSQGFVQPQDFFATLIGAVGAAESGRTGDGRDLRRVIAGETEPRDRMLATFGDQYALRTPAWFLRQSATDGAMLFSKPDDFWEANEVARRCHSVVQKLQEAHSAVVEAVAAGALDQLPELPDVLVHGLE